VREVVVAKANAKILGVDGIVLLTTKKLMFIYAKGQNKKVLTIPLIRIRVVSVSGVGPFRRVVLNIIGKKRELSLKIAVKRPDVWAILLEEILDVHGLGMFLGNIKEDILEVFDKLSLIRWKVCSLIRSLSDLVSMASGEEPIDDRRKMLAMLVSETLTDIRSRITHLASVLEELRYSVIHVAKLIDAKRDHLSELMSDENVGLLGVRSSFESIILELRTLHRSLNELRWSLHNLERSLSWCKALVDENEIMDILHKVCPHEWAGKAPDVLECKICGLERPCEHLWYRVAPGKERCAKCGKVRFKRYEW